MQETQDDPVQTLSIILEDDKIFEEVRSLHREAVIHVAKEVRANELCRVIASEHARPLLDLLSPVVENDPVKFDKIMDYLRGGR